MTSRCARGSSPWKYVAARVREADYRGMRFMAEYVPMDKNVFRIESPVNNLLPFEERKCACELIGKFQNVDGSKRGRRSGDCLAIHEVGESV